jgi:hypothetical protein
MCKAIELAQEMNDRIVEAKNYHYALGKKLQTLDIAQQDLLHKIENMDKFNLMEAWKITKALSQVRCERRKIKNDLDTMGIFINMFINKQNADISINNIVLKLKNENEKLINNCKNKTYNNRILTEKDPLNSTNTMLKNLNETNFSIYKNLLSDDINNTKNNESDTIYKISKIYNYGERQLKKDKGKGSSIKIRYSTQKQYNSIKNIIVPQYESFSVNTNQKYFHLICKKF